VTPELPKPDFDTGRKPAAFVLELRPLTTGWRVPVEVRLRAVLKRLLRTYGFRCVKVSPSDQRDEETPPP
jgi:hypothetical protein